MAKKSLLRIFTVLFDPLQVQETQSAFDPRAQRSVYRRRGVRPQQRSFAMRIHSGNTA